MKNQYFGDKRDYFKYSLLEALVAGIAGIELLTCIWMLTSPVANNDGRKPFVPHPDYPRLTAFFGSCAAAGIANVTEMARYFKGQGVRFFSYGDQADGYFESSDRSAYFENVPSIALQESVVFFDPDNGMEPRGKCKPAHLRYDELAAVFRRMGPTSIAVVYQHLPRIRGSVFWPLLAAKLDKRLATVVAYIADGDLAFFVAPTDSARAHDILRVLDKQVNQSGPRKMTKGVTRPVS
jgi:hypothetical protein